MGAKYSAIAAKLKAMYASALSEQDFVSLSEKKTVSEICGFLKNTEAYGGALKNLSENDAHRGEIEFLMGEKLTDDFMRIYRFVDKRDSDIIEFFLIRREINFLKHAIHYIYTKEERGSGAIRDDTFDSFFRRRSKINREIMKNASSLEDCVAACRGTIYEEPLTLALNTGADFFMTGTILDGFYYRTLWKEIHSKLPKRDAEGFEKIIGAAADMLNIMWTYRGKKYFGFADETIFSYLLPVSYRMSTDMIRALVNASDADAVAAETANTPYAGLFDGLENGLFIEENFNYIIYKAAKSVFASSTDTLASVPAYVKLKEWEIWRITTVIEGVRYGKAPEFIQKHIRTDERGVV